MSYGRGVHLQTWMFLLIPVNTGFKEYQVTFLSTYLLISIILYYSLLRSLYLVFFLTQLTIIEPPPSQFLSTWLFDSTLHSPTFVKKGPFFPIFRTFLLSVSVPLPLPFHSTRWPLYRSSSLTLTLSTSTGLSVHPHGRFFSELTYTWEMLRQRLSSNILTDAPPTTLFWPLFPWSQ